MAITDLTAFELSQKIASREVSAMEVLEAYLKRIASTEPAIDAYLSVTEETAREQAAAVDSALDSGAEAGPLAGVPLAIKDNILVEGVAATAGSRILEGFVSPYDATVVARLKAAGAVILGKANLDEFAMGSSCEYSAFKITHNPYHTDRVPGGSSGGSAAAVAAGSAPAALGSDTGGSIRQPAALCGIAGLKPTYGTVSRYGLVAFASSLDQVGPLARDTRDLALIMSVISGPDHNDSTSYRSKPPAFLKKLDADISGAVLGVPREYVSQVVNDDVKSRFDSAVETFEKLGAQIREISLPHTDYAIATYYIIAPAEASSNLARYTGTHYANRLTGGKLARDVVERTRTLFGPEVKRRIILGSFVLSSGYYDAYYLRAARTRNVIRGDFDKAFSECDALLSPTTPSPAFRLGEKMTDPLEMYLYDVMNVGVNLAGIPALSVPCGFSSDDLPVGLQIIGPADSDARILGLGRAFEKETGFYNRIAPVTGGNAK